MLQRIGGQRAFVLGLVLGVAASVLAGWLGHRAHELHEAALASLCSSGMLEVRAPLQIYREQHGGALPLRADDLDLSFGGPDALHCPKARAAGRRAYLYIPADARAPADTPVLLCWRHPKLQLLTKGGSFRRVARGEPGTPVR